MARKVIKLNEKQLKNIVQRVISEKTKNSRRPIKEQSFNPFGDAGEPTESESTTAIVQYPGDTVWEYTQKEGTWHTRKKGADKWISLGDSKYKSTVDKLNKAFPKGAKGGGKPGGDVKGSEEEGKSSFLDKFKPCVKKFPTKNDRAYRAIFDAVDGWGTDERKLFRALDELNNWDEWVSMNKVIQCATKYGKTVWGMEKGYNNMYDFIADDLSGADLREFRTILRGLKQKKGSGDQGSQGAVADDTSSGKSNVPFKNRQEGDKFRAWVNKQYPDYAKEIDLDVSGPHNNSFVAKAWAKYGNEYKG